MIKKELVVVKDPRAPISENFRAMRTNLQFMNSSEDNNQTILITSTLCLEPILNFSAKPSCIQGLSESCFKPSRIIKPPVESG